MKYASFWQRLLGLTIDFLLIIPVFLAYSHYVEGLSRPLAMILLLPVCMSLHLYEVYCHARWGQTLGKMVARTKIIMHDGFPVAVRAALLRSAVGIGFSLVFICAREVALYRAPETVFAGLTWAARQRILMHYSPEPVLPPHVSEVWFWSEVVVMLLNRKRRALHDFIANTVVIDIRKKKRTKKITLLHGIKVTVDPSIFDDPDDGLTPRSEAATAEPDGEDTTPHT